MEEREFKAVIWDFGGVFTTSPFEAFARYECENGLPPNLIRQINGMNHLTNAWARFERAELSLEEFDKAFADEALAFGHCVPGKEVIALLAGDIRPEMHEALRRIKQRYKTGCITNNVTAMRAGASPESNAESVQAEARLIEERNARALGGGVSRDPFYKHDVMVLFDCVIESSKVGIRKPDPRIYRMMCAALHVPPDACIYLDDLGVNLKPARAMGMHTIKVESSAQAITELEKATRLTLA